MAWKILGVSIIWPALSAGVVLLFLMTVRMNYVWQRAVIFRLGKLHNVAEGGLYFLLPIIDSSIKLDKRLITMDIASQEVITKDNVSVHIDAVVFYKIEEVTHAVLNVENYLEAIRQQSFATLRDIVGENKLDSLLAHRDAISEKIKKQVDSKTKEWGIDIDQVKLQNIQLPQDMKRIMARQAEAEREGKGIIIKAAAELEAAEKLKQAAEILAKSEGGLQLRMLSTISDVSQDRSNTLVFAMPMDVMRSQGVALAAAGLSKSATTFDDGQDATVTEESIELAEQQQSNLEEYETEEDEDNAE